MGSLSRIFDGLVSWGVSHGVRVVGIAILVLVLSWLLRLGVKSFLKFFLHEEPEGSAKDKRVRTLSRVLSMAGNIIILISGVMMILSELGIDMKPLLASVGIGGVALGFGAQSLVKDLIAGFFIILEDQIRVGDVVKVGDKGGLVESVGLRVMVLRDLSGNRIIIPNGEITSVTNMTYNFSRYVFKIGVAYKEDVDRVIETIKAVGDGMQKDGKWRAMIKEPIEVFGLDEFGDSALIIAGRLTTAPLKQWEVGREFNRRIKKAFDEKGIEIPFPHRTIYYGDKAEAGEKKS